MSTPFTHLLLTCKFYTKRIFTHYQLCHNTLSARTTKRNLEAKNTRSPKLLGSCEKATLFIEVKKHNRAEYTNKVSPRLELNLNVWIPERDFLKRFFAQRKVYNILVDLRVVDEKETARASIFWEFLFCAGDWHTKGTKCLKRWKREKYRICNGEAGGRQGRTFGVIRWSGLVSFIFAWNGNGNACR